MWKKILFIILLIVIGFLIFRYFKTHGLPTRAQVENGLAEYQGNFEDNLHTYANSLAPGSSLNTPRPTVDVKDFGTPSPLYGKVIIDELDSRPGAPSPQEEYIHIRASDDNTEHISLAGWSLQSMVSGTRVFLPDAVEDIVVNDINETYEPTLAPGQDAYITSGSSPIGVSFRTNLCTGYLNQYQHYEPPLPEICPSPSEILPATPENISSLGRDCIAFVQENLSACQYVDEETAEQYDLTPQCVSALQGLFTYTYCRGQYHFSPDYYRSAQWRLFLDSPRRLWGAEYEVIRLLDEKGRTVAVWQF